jgi:hypothetical protein
MRIFDKFETLVGEADHSFTIMGNLTTSDFALIETSTLPLSESARHDLVQRGMGWLGVVGLVAGQPKTALDTPLGAPVIAALAEAFLQVLAKKLADNDPVLAELAALYALPDTRPAN